MSSNFRDIDSKITKKYTVIYLLIILVIATLLRVLFLGTIPNGFFCDEASNAYDSYSILNTLKDQHGAFLPFFTRSIDDYREALFIYLGIPFIKLFGLNEFAARLPAAFTGILTVLVIYYLVKELFDNKTALIASFLFEDMKYFTDSIHYTSITGDLILDKIFSRAQNSKYSNFATLVDSSTMPENLRQIRYNRERWIQDNSQVYHWVENLKD
ncbi:MAG: glycosyltransferase family 39 protein [Xenococcaceae cyanobacterium MO_167.B27]|nr:glycosyltransferase family 39 protein [Xenococcaceae cyanobacterium MO_167.B27]